MDGHGIAHPRRAGIATHLGVILGKPTVGIAKKPLIKTPLPSPSPKGTFYPLMDDKEQVGWILFTRPYGKPIFLSPGNRVSLSNLPSTILSITGKYRIPEPIRYADRTSKIARRGEPLPPKVTLYPLKNLPTL